MFNNNTTEFLPFIYPPHDLRDIWFSVVSRPEVSLFEDKKPTIAQCELGKIKKRIPSSRKPYGVSHSFSAQFVNGNVPILWSEGCDGKSAPSDYQIEYGLHFTPFGAAFILKLTDSNSKLYSALVVDPNDPNLEMLERGDFYWLIGKSRKNAWLYRLDFTSCMEDFKFALHSMKSYEPFYENMELNYWTQVSKKIYSGVIDIRSRPERLQCGWNYSFIECMLRTEKMRRALIEESTPLNSVPSVCQELFALLLKDDFRFIDAEKYLDALLEDSSRTYTLINDAIENPTFIGNLFFVLQQTVILYTMLPKNTDCGRKFTFFSAPYETKSNLVSYSIEPEHFPSDQHASHYWYDLPNIWPAHPFWYLSGRDTPIPHHTLVNDVPNIRLKGDIEETNECSELILSEAYVNKRWTIPYGARVALPLGPFTSAQFYEHHSGAHVLLRTVKGEYQLANIFLDGDFTCYMWPLSASVGEDSKQFREIKAAIRHVLTLIIRDFWVVEERSRVFKCVLRSERCKQLGSHTSQPSSQMSVIYLPKVAYNTVVDAERSMEKLNFEERRGHYVSGHLRKVNNASDKQLDIARIMGVRVPTGYTFVSPHYKGEVTREAIYKSRSALAALYSKIDDLTDGIKSTWFEFEHDVKDFLNENGFTAEHYAVSKRGDDGVDILAKRVRRARKETWFIQCKCWSPKRKVGPAVIRELMGSLAQLDSNAKGMVVTTSSFSEKAAEVAKEAGIMLIDGCEFKDLKGIDSSGVVQDHFIRDDPSHREELR